MKISFEEMWKKLEKYFIVDHVLEQGFSNGKYTMILAKYAKNVVGIDVSEDFLKVANENLKDYNNIKLYLMDAQKMNFSDKSFDAILNTSFHEFDLSHGFFNMDLDLKRKILEEMIRVSNTIIFIEPTETAVTNELFKVFDSSEQHDIRIEESNKLISSVMDENGYKLIETGLTYNRDDFASREELEEAMLDWWSDIKVPTTEKERNLMISQIDDILNKAGMLNYNYVIEDIRFNVYRKVN